MTSTPAGQLYAAGIDPVFFGLFIVLMCEISLISPPAGMTLYVIQGVRGEGSINDVFHGTLSLTRANANRVRPQILLACLGGMPSACRMILASAGRSGNLALPAGG